MGLRKKLGVLLFILGLVLLFSGIIPEATLITGNFFKEYSQGGSILTHSLGIIFLVMGLAFLIERKSLDYLIIPTGDDLNEMKRAKKAAEEKAGHYIIAGYGKKEGKLIYDELRKKDVKPSDLILEKRSKDTLENVMYSFEKMENPKSVGIVSYPEHLRRFEMIIEKAKEEGKIPKGVKITYLPIEQSFKETFYGILANIKEKKRLKKGIDSAMKNPTKGVWKLAKGKLGNEEKEG